MARRAVDQELSRERILEAARHLFITKGYRAISMRSIGQHLGYSHGSLYYHFKEKAELFYAIVMEDFKALGDILMHAVNATPDEGLGQAEYLLLEFIRFGIENPYQYEIMFLIRDEELLAYCRAEQSRCLELFASIVRNHLGAEPHTEESRERVPHSIFLALHGFISYYIQDKITFEEVKPTAIAHVQLLCKSI